MKHFNTLKREKISDEALAEIYERLRTRNAPKPGTFSALDDAGRSAYFREAVRRSRAAAAENRAAGKITPTKPNIRDAFADAALMILATDAPGADQVRAVLAAVFSGRPGTPMAIENKAKRGRLRPKLFRADERAKS